MATPAGFPYGELQSLREDVAAIRLRLERGSSNKARLDREFRKAALRRSLLHLKSSIEHTGKMAATVTKHRRQLAEEDSSRAEHLLPDAVERLRDAEEVLQKATDRQARSAGQHYNLTEAESVAFAKMLKKRVDSVLRKEAAAWLVDEKREQL